MADPKPSIFNIENLNQLGARLFDHAETLAGDGSPHEIEQILADIRLAANATDKLASLRFRVSEIASDATTPPATRRDPLSALDDAQAEPSADWPESFSRSSHHSS